ncbi:endonuclease III [Clostridium sp. DL1XJH146]
MEKERVHKIVELLQKTYDGAKCGLEFKNSYQLLISTILSAQCTDERVNIITEELYKDYGNATDMIELSREELGEKIRSCGLYKNKSKNILLTTKELLDKYNGQVPNDFEKLISLPGVGRKTANVVLANAFGKDAIAVDTHVFRVANRIGLAKGKTPLQVEEKLMEILPKETWSNMHHYLIWHGRKICKARKPLCEDCPINTYCEFYKY